MIQIQKAPGATKSPIVRAFHALLGLIDRFLKVGKKKAKMNWPEESKDEEAWRIDSFLMLQKEYNNNGSYYPRYDIDKSPSTNIRKTSWI